MRLEADKHLNEMTKAHKRDKKLTEGSCRKEAVGSKQTIDESDMALLGLHAQVYKEISCIP